MRLPEQRFWDRMRRHLAMWGSIRLERIENIVGAGTPDVWALANGVVTPCELKAVPLRPARTTTRLLSGTDGLSVDQANWALSWRQHGGRSLVLISVGISPPIALDGRWAELINDWTETTMLEHACATSWVELAQQLGAT